MPAECLQFNTSVCQDVAAVSMYLKVLTVFARFMVISIRSFSQCTGGNGSNNEETVRSSSSIKPESGDSPGRPIRVITVSGRRHERGARL